MRVSDELGEIIAEIDPDGIGFRSSEAAGMLLYRAVRQLDLGREEDLPVLPATLMRKGAQQAVREYSPDAVSQQQAENAAVRAAVSPQRDMAEMDDSFAWTRRFTALDETREAVRKRIAALTYSEVLQVIALKRRKAAEANATAKRLQDVVDRHPEWARHPKRTLAEVTGAA